MRQSRFSAYADLAPGEGDVLVFSGDLRERRDTAEHRLYTALLLDALNKYTACKRLTIYLDGRKCPRKRIMEEIDAWMDGGSAAVSFEYACEVLGLEPDAVRMVFQTSHRKEKDTHSYPNFRKRWR